MNNTFNPGRFFQLFKKHTRENLPFYLMSLLVLTGILIISFSYIAYQTEGRLAYERDFQFQLYLVFLLLSGSIFSSTVFSHLGNSRSRTMSLILPSSTYEKFMVGWIYVFMIFPLLYTAIFYLVDLGLVLSLAKNQQIKILNVFSMDTDGYVVFLLFYLLTSLGLLGAIVFRNLHFIKTAALFFVCAFILVVLNTAFIEHLIIKPMRISVPFGGLNVQHEKNYFHISVGSELKYLIGTILIIVPILWLSAYLKLKEKEV